MTETGLKNLIDELAMKDVKDIDVLKILDIPSYLKIFNLNFPSSKKAILDKLCEEKIIQKSKNSSYHVTNLGAQETPVRKKQPGNFKKGLTNNNIWSIIKV